MKRAIGFILIVAACVVGFLSVRGTLPFMPITGASMQPAFKSGDLILIEEVSSSQVEVGDVIVFNVPPLVQDAYNYPPVIAHRVIRIIPFGDVIGFRTKGDNTGEDPFTVRPIDLRGTVSKHYSSLGFPFLFFQSQQGMIFAITALSLLAIFLYGNELSLSGRRLQRGVFAPVIEETHRTNRVLVNKIETTEQRMDSTQQALEKFASAIEVYAQHLASHTSAIQGLSEASHELKKGAAEQNKIMTHLVERMEQPRPRKEEIISRVEPAMVEMEKPMPEAEKPAPEAETTPPKVERVQSPPGCAISRQALLKRIREAVQKTSD